MSELNYKELQEKGVFNAPYKAFQFMQEQQAIIDELKHQKSLQELEINQISQSNQEWQRINSDLQKRIDEYKKLTTSIRNEFDLWSDDSEFADVIEAQIENLEALRGAND